MLLDDPGIAAGVGGGRRVGLEGDQRGRPPDGLEQPSSAALIGHGDGVGRLSLAVEGADRFEDVTVSRFVEIVGRTHLHRRRDGVTRQEHGADQALLGLQVVGWYPTPAPSLAAANVVEGLDHGYCHLARCLWSG